ncbi:helix-turn-helix domain-containing protein [Pseudomonas sp. NPDC047961]
MKLDKKELVESIRGEIASYLGIQEKAVALLVDSEVAAVVLGIEKDTLATWRHNGAQQLPFLKIGRAVRYRISDLADYLARRSSLNTGDAHDG